MKTKKTPAEKLAYKLNRLGAPGYYVCMLRNPKGPLTHYHGVVYIAPTGKCHAVHWMGESGWCTLQWSCAPTKKMVQGKSGFYDYEYYPTWDDMVANCTQKIPPQATASKPKIDVTP
jgi:hypothetical protein